MNWLLRWRDFTRTDLATEQRDSLLKKYSPSEAVAFFRALQLNLECKLGLKNNSIVKRDEYNCRDQNQADIALCALGTLIARRSQNFLGRTYSVHLIPKLIRLLQKSTTERRFQQISFIVFPCPGERKSNPFLPSSPKVRHRSRQQSRQITRFLIRPSERR